MIFKIHSGPLWPQSEKKKKGKHQVKTDSNRCGKLYCLCKNIPHYWFETAHQGDKLKGKKTQYKQQQKGRLK